MEHDPRNIIGLRVRELRDKKELTQEQLTARCQVLGLEITRSALARIESRRRGVADHEVHFLAQALRVPVHELFPEKVEPILRHHQNPDGAARRRKKPKTARK